MANCVYCGQPAGFLRRRHVECQERHARAIAMIPGLFAKALHSSLPAARFGELLQNAAAASFIKPADLSLLCVEGVGAMIDAVLEQRLLTLAEERRVAEITDALGPVLADKTKLDEKFAKMNILRVLGEGKIPDRVTVVGPMPINLRLDETVIWIFNHAICYQRRASPSPDPGPPGIPFPATDKDLYCGRQASSTNLIPMGDLLEEAVGDLVVTNRNIHFLFDEGHKRISMAKITALQPYADGMHITCEQSQGRSRTFKVDDPWLASNLIVGLIKLAQR
jgi:hypothetical protein